MVKQRVSGWEWTMKYMQWMLVVTSPLTSWQDISIEGTKSIDFNQWLWEERNNDVIGI